MGKEQAGANTPASDSNGTIPGSATVENDTLEIEEVDKWDKQFQALSQKQDALIASMTEATTSQKNMLDRLDKYLTKAEQAETEAEAKKALEEAQKVAAQLSTSQTSQSSPKEGEDQQEAKTKPQAQQGRERGKQERRWL